MKKILFILFCLLLIGIELHAQAWVNLANVPKALSFPVVVTVNNEIHVMGGGATGGASSLHIRYKPLTDVWDTLAPVPYLAQQPAGAVLNGKIHYFGGGFPNSGTPLASHYIYNPATNTWSVAASLPIPRVIMEAGVVNGKLYALSGQPDKSRVDEYDPLTNTWALKNPLPDNNFWYSAIAVHNNEMYRFGGGGYLAPVTSIHKYDQINDAWNSIASLPVALHAPSAASMIGSIYIAGGYNGSETNAFRAFNATNLTFNNATSLPVGRCYHEIVAIDTCIYSVGGNNNSSPGVGTSLIRYCKSLPNPVGIKDNNLFGSVMVFPNPATNKIYIQSDRSINSLELFDVSGKQLLQQSPSSVMSEIDMSTLDVGVYFLSISCDGNIYHRKVIKE